MARTSVDQAQRGLCHALTVELLCQLRHTWTLRLQALRGGMRVSASFLNNSSSRWEAVWDAWEFRAELVDHVSPIYRSDFLR